MKKIQQVTLFEQELIILNRLFENRGSVTKYQNSYLFYKGYTNSHFEMKGTKVKVIKHIMYILKAILLLYFPY